MEKQINLLKKKIQELTSENQILREINVKLQIENYNLSKKLESKQQIEESSDDSIDKTDTVVVEDPSGNPDYYEVLYSNDPETVETEEEYLEEIPYNMQQDVKSEKTQDQQLVSNRKRKYSRGEDDIQIEDDKVSKEEINFQLIFDNDSSEYLFENLEALEDENTKLNPKEAMNYIFRLAAKTPLLTKIQSIEQGKSKDSLFVSKVLDLLFDRVTLANSTVHGQKCQSKLHLPAKPPLDSYKMDICMKAFIYRLRQENIDAKDMESRVKSFNKMVNDKIQNCRKCLLRIDASKVIEK